MLHVCSLCQDLFFGTKVIVKYFHIFFFSTLQIISEEIEKITEAMKNVATPKAFDFCRRGALYRKVSNSIFQSCGGNGGRVVSLKRI